MNAVDRSMEPRFCFIAAHVLNAIDAALSPARRRRVEGIAYLLGRTDGLRTCLLACMSVDARATRGSFHVTAKEMVRVVNLANELGLQVAGQVHTHPLEAFHSEGDDAGAQIRFDGYVSIVLPDYGRHLPSLSGAAAFMYSTRSNAFIPIPFDAKKVIQPSL